MGCNIDMIDIKKRLKACTGGIYISNVVGGHEVVFKDKKGWLYLETDTAKCNALKLKRNLK